MLDISNIGHRQGCNVTATYLNDCNTAFMKHVFPRFRSPEVFGRIVSVRSYKKTVSSSPRQSTLKLIIDPLCWSLARRHDKLAQTMYEDSHRFKSLLFAVVGVIGTLSSRLSTIFFCLTFRRVKIPWSKNIYHLIITAHCRYCICNDKNYKKGIHISHRSDQVKWFTAR